MASAIDRVRVVYEAQVNQFNSGVQSATKNMNTFSRQTENSSNKVANSFNRLTPMVRTFVGAFAVGSLVNFSSKLSNQVDQMDKLAKRLGTTTEALSELKFVSEQNGVAFNSFTMAMQRMTRRLAEAANGTGEAKNALAELNIDAQKINNLPLDKQFEVIADSLHGLKSDADRVRLAFKFFDAEGVSLLQTMGNGSEGIRQYRDQAKELGLTLKQDTADSIVKAKDEIHKLTSFIESKAIIALGNLSSGAISVGEDMAYTVNKLNDLLVKSSSVLNQTVSEFGKGFASGIRDNFQPVFDMIDKLTGKSTDVERINQQFNEKLGSIARSMESGQKRPEVPFFGEGDEILNRDTGEPILQSTPDSPMFGTPMTDVTPAQVTTQGEDQGMGVVPTLRDNGLAQEALSRVEQEKRDNDVILESRREFNDELSEEEEMSAEERARLIEQSQSRIHGILKNAAKQQLALEKASNEQKLQAYVGTGLQILNTLSKNSETMFKITKGLSLAEAIVSTASAVTKVLPNIPAAIAVGLAGAAEIATIASTNFSGGGSTSGGGGGGGASAGGALQTASAAQQETPQEKSNDLDISISGVSPDDIFTGQQMRNLISSINDQVQDEGVNLNSIRVV